ncbi:nck-associated protein 5 isoform X2 [Nannospalax galili]|uniref:nck-associated protein 5 isoform X2 n=1 Tax=Nannospalax galili TaxID=1026970 RepID=UPI00111C3A26|nr:nck-associated protein 5 isoform X2 [Nannospalax galili]
MEGKRQLEKRDSGKRLSLDSSLMEYMDSNKCIEHLLTQLREQHRSLWREKLAVARLQREVAQRTSEGAMHEKLIHELEEERHLRLQSEKRLREVTLESECNRIQMRSLQQRFSRMEETVRSLLQSQGCPEQKKEETVKITVYQERLSEEERKHQEALGSPHMVVDEDSRSRSSCSDEGKDKTKLLLERLKALEAENSALALENENQREQYERCLDEDLREECVKLKTRVFDLEQQNRTLSILFQQRVRPVSDLLLQKLHSRVVDLSSGDLISESGRSRSLTQSWTDTELHEHLQNAKSGSSALKRSGSGAVVSRHLCPHSCSSSELSLSSTCSEYSSGSSYTCQDGRHLEKRQSSQNWDKRLSIDSSLPSGFASPADELPPTRIKESHILEGLRKLQKRKVLLEPPSVINRWGYKDCMNSNEGIYSPGIKSSSLKEYAPCQPPGMGSPCKELCKTLAYDADSHEDADEDSPSSTLPQAAVSQGCRIQGSRLTHSLSDSLFSWELHGKHFSEATASVYTRERPERLTHCASHWPLERKLCPSMHTPRVQRDRDLHSQGHDHVALSFQLSDTDDIETLGELHIESSDERSPSDLSLTIDTDKSMENLDVGFRKSECRLHDDEEEQSSHLDMRPKTFSFIRQQRVVKKTSSEECITVIFDAENGEPVEFSSHQTGVVTVTRDELSINPVPTGSTEKHTELSAQGITHLQPGANARDYPCLRRHEEKTGKDTPKDEENSILIAPTDSFSPRTTETQITPRPKLPKPTQGVACQSNPRSLASTGIYQKRGRTKIPSRGKSSPQKSKMVEPVPSMPGSPSDLVTLENSPASPSGKFSPYMKIESLGAHCDVGADPHIPKHSTQLPHIPKISSKKDWVQCPKNHTLGIWSRSLIETGDSGDSPMRDKHCGSGPEAGVRSPSPPPPPGRSVSLLFRPGYNHPPSPSSAKLETRHSSDTVSSAFKSPALKSAAVISSSPAMSEMQRKKPSTTFKKPAFSPTLPSTEAVMHSQYAEHVPSSSLSVIAPGPPKVPSKTGILKPAPHQALGTTHVNTGLQTLKTCPSTHELLEVATSKSLSPGKKGQLSDSTTIHHRLSFPGANESPPSQVSSPSFSSSSSCRNQTTSQSYQNPPEKGPKTRLPVGLKVLTKSPQLLRKSCTVPGKQEKDSLNEASRSSVAANKSKTGDSRDSACLETSGDKRNTALLDLQVADRLPLESALPESSESSIRGAGGRDRLQNRSVKRSFSSSKPHLKPALGMNGAKARSQSFSVHSGEKLSTTPTEGPGKIRTQIITNTAERGNSLTRQNISTEGSPSKTPFAPTSESLPSAGRPQEHSFSRQESLSSTGSSCSQHGSPNKLLLRSPTRSEGLLTPPRMEDHQVYTQEECPRTNIPEEASNDHRRYPPPQTVCPQSLQVSGRMQHLSHLETSRISKLETSGMHPDAPPTGTGVMSSEAPLTPSIEEKVMLCIQENVEKGQAQTKSTSVEVKPRTGPSFASWFGFRKSRLPALSSRKIDASKSKIEKKDTKLKSERKKEKKKPEGQSKIENELTRGTKSADGLSPDNGLQSKNNLKTSQDIYNQMKLEPRNRLSPVACSTKDTFMTELLNRVDKKAAPETESGSKSISCRNVLKGTSQGSCSASGSVSTQGSQKKTIKAKADMEIPRESLVTEVDEDLREDEEDIVPDSALPSHIIESNCQMRTLDSGIGTFPLPDSGTRSTGRYICQSESPEDTEPLLPLQPAPSTASSARAQTLEREVPSSADNQCSSESSIIHSISDPGMMTRGMQAPQSLLPKPTSSGKNSFQKQNGAESRPQTHPSFEYAEDTAAREPLPRWRGEDAATETQELKQVEETKDPENRLSKISLESFNKFNSNAVILLEKENAQSKVEGQKEEREKNEAPLSSSDRPVLDNLESLSDSLYDSFSSCVSQTSNDV